MNFTPDLLNAVLEKYVFRTKFTEKDREYVSKQSEDIENFDPEKTLEHLIENSEGRLDIYAPAGELLKNLKVLVAFTKNGEFLGYHENRVNFEDIGWLYTDRASSTFMMKSDLSFFLFQNLKSFQDEVSIHLLKAYSHKIYRILKKTLEYIPENTIIKMYEEACQTVKIWVSTCSHKYTADSYNFVEYTPEEVFSTISKFYDAENDQEFLAELQEQLKRTSKKMPIKLNLKYYANVLLRCHYIEQIMKYCLEKYLYIFLPNPKINKNFPHFRVIRVLELYEQKYVFVKDLEFALIDYENVKIDVETEEERKNGIILTMEYSEFENILEQAGLTASDIHMIPLFNQTTKHDVNVPILTSYGTHCKLAGDAFREVFRVFSIDISWFNTVSEKNYYKLIDWFNSISDIFDGSRDGLYFIEVWKIEELKNQVYEQMKKYTRKPKYEPPNVMRFMTKDEIYKEIKKFGSNFQMNTKCWKLLWLSTQEDKNMSKWDVLVLYDWYCLFQFTLESSKMAKFFSTQLDDNSFLVEYAVRAPPPNMLVFQTSRTHDAELTQIIKFFCKLDAHLIRFSNEYIYSMSTLNSGLYYQNETCLKLALDKTIIDEESVKSKIISLVYEAEIRKFENQRRSVFYLVESEFKEFSQMVRRIHERVMVEHTYIMEKCALEAEQFEQLWQTHFPIDQYSEQFHESIKEILKSDENCDELITVGLKARRIFEECSEKIRSFKNYCRENKERTVVMRIMSDIRIDDFDEWHMFSEEVLEAIDIVLENEGRLDTMKDKIENWRNKWTNGECFATVTVQLFTTILNVVGIEHSKFLFMPDVQFFKNYIDLPLKMGYNAMKVLSPDGREVYHQVQAQFLMFQYGVCDVIWNSDNKKAKNKQRKKVMEEMKKIGKGYTLAGTIEDSVEVLKYSDVAQKTPLSLLHGKAFNTALTNEELQEISMVTNSKYKSLSCYQIKSILMYWTLFSFLKNNQDEELKKSIYKGFSMIFGFIYLKNATDFEKWYSAGLEKSDFTNFDTMKVIATTNLKNESARTTYDVEELIEQHYLFDACDTLGTSAKKKIGNRKNYKEEEVKNGEDDMNKIQDLISKMNVSLPDEVSESMDHLCELVEDYIQKEFDEEVATILRKALKTNEAKKLLRIKFSEQLEITNIDGVEVFRKRKVEESEKKVKSKKEEGPKVVVKYVTETKTVENCVNCRNIEKETMGFMRKIEKLEKEIENYKKEIEENQKVVKQKEEDSIMLKNQIGQNKLKYREEIQKHKGDLEGRDLKIEQLNQEIKEYREDSKLERETLYAEARKSSKKAEESVKKMKAELENSKFLETAKNKKIDELTAENSQLKTSLEIAEENLEVYKKESEEAENRLKFLEKRNQEMTLFLEDSVSEEDLYLDSELNVGPFEEILRFDVYGILDKIGEVSESFGIPKSEIVRFQRRYDMYIRIVENENCWETAEIPDFPIPFSAEFMQDYESCLKDNFMGNSKEAKWYNCIYTSPANSFFDPNQGFYM